MRDEDMEECVWRLGHPHWLVDRRALQELAMLGPKGRKAVAPLLARLSRSGGGDKNAIEVVLALEAIGDDSLSSMLMDSIERAAFVDSENLAALLLGLARQGSAARGSSERLDALLTREELDDDYREVVCAVLWCIEGSEGPSRVEDVRRALQAGGEPAGRVLWALSLAGRLPEDARLVVPDLIACAEGERHVHRDLALVSIGPGLGSGAADYLPQLRRLRNRLEDDPNRTGDAIFAAFTIARVSHDRQDLEHAVSLAAFEEDGELDGQDHVSIAICMFVGTALVDSWILDGLIQLLESDQAKHRAGALNVLCGVGRRARRAAPRILELVRTDPDETVRELAATAMAFVADASFASKLREIQSSLSEDEDDLYLNRAIAILEGRNTQDPTP